MAATTQIVRCGACGANNRIAADGLRAHLQPICGRCKRPLSAPAAVKIVTDSTFAAEVERSSLPVLVDFWAPWCGPCRTVAPILEELAIEYAGRLLIAKLNVEDQPLASRRYRVEGIPTLILFQGGREADRIVGAAGKAELARRIELLLKAD